MKASACKPHMISAQTSVPDPSIPEASEETSILLVAECHNELLKQSGGDKSGKVMSLGEWVWSPKVKGKKASLPPVETAHA